MERDLIVGVARADADGLRTNARRRVAPLRFGEANLLRWLRWLGRNDLILIGHIAAIVLFGMSIGQ